jgi:hypothetical protein
MCARRRPDNCHKSCQHVSQIGKRPAVAAAVPQTQVDALHACYVPMHSSSAVLPAVHDMAPTHGECFWSGVLRTCHVPMQSWPSLTGTVSLLPSTMESRWLCAFSGSCAALQCAMQQCTFVQLT